MQSSARAEDAPRHRQVLVPGGLLGLLGDRAHNRLGSPLAFPKARAAPWMCPVQQGWGLCALPSSPQALTCSDKEAATCWCLLVTTVGYFLGGKRICI